MGPCRRIVVRARARARRRYGEGEGGGEGTSSSSSERRKGRGQLEGRVVVESSLLSVVKNVLSSTSRERKGREPRDLP